MGQKTIKSFYNFKIKIVIFFLFLSFFSISSLFANALTITNVSLTEQDTSNGTVKIEFDISWNNSWRDSINYDAAWVFVKYSTDSGATWHHATLKTAGTNPTGFSTGTIDPSRSDISYIEIIVPEDKKGCFIQPSSLSEGESGTVDFDNVQIVWDWQTDGLSANSSVIVKVFGIEMAFIPTASFYMGDTNNTLTNGFRVGGGSTPYQVASEGEIIIANTAGNLYYDADNAYSGDQSGPLLAGFPKGYRSFYVMKYEISQAQYRDFLNTLTRTQQNNRTQTQTANYYAMSNCSSLCYRNTIRLPSSVGAGKITFGCDYDQDGTFDESTDGEWIAMNYLSWPDLCAYLDWASLRPMTELEFEKVARGPLDAVNDEYVWGTSADLTQATGISSAGQNSEVASNSAANCVYGNHASVQGPLRVGFTQGSTRITTGSGYYGVMELAGNVWEQVVTVGNSAGRTFRDINGDGELTSDGYADVSTWPGLSGGKVTGSDGAGRRGGDWEQATTELFTTSSRYLATLGTATRFPNIGGRGVRTYP